VKKILAVLACSTLLLIAVPAPASAHEGTNCKDLEGCIRHCFHYHHEIGVCVVTHMTKL
jgi:hypothetical protein